MVFREEMKMDDLSLENFRTDFLGENGAFRFVVITSVPERYEAYDGIGIEADSYCRHHVPTKPFELLLKLFGYLASKLGLYLTKPYDYFHVGELIIATTDRDGSRPMEVCWGGKPGKHNCTWETFTSLREALEFVKRVEDAFIDQKDTALIRWRDNDTHEQHARVQSIKRAGG